VEPADDVVIEEQHFCDFGAGHPSVEQEHGVDPTCIALLRRSIPECPSRKFLIRMNRL